MAMDEKFWADIGKKWKTQGLILVTLNGQQMGKILVVNLGWLSFDIYRWSANILSMDVQWTSQTIVAIANVYQFGGLNNVASMWERSQKSSDNLGGRNLQDSELQSQHIDLIGV